MRDSSKSVKSRSGHSASAGQKKKNAASTGAAPPRGATAGPEWFVACGGATQGPLTTAEVLEKVVLRELSPADYVWKPGQPEWKRLFEVKGFEAVVPPRPQVKPAQPAPQPPAAPRSESKRTWYLHRNGSQYGPFSQAELESALERGKVSPRVHAWKAGLSGWERLERLPEFQAWAQKRAPQEQVPRPPRFPGKSEPEAEAIGEPAVEERRATPRKPLVAHILMSDQQSVLVGMCRDISIGGLQVLTDSIPGPVGTRLRMNISPPDLDGSSSHGSGSRSARSGSSPAAGSIRPFVAEGVVVRLLEDGCGFSFRFSQLSESSLKAIESYIESEEL
jgi:hypothetical protein